MHISRYLNTRSFLAEAQKLKAVKGHITESTLERLESQRSLIPRLRVRYPDPVARRFWAEENSHSPVYGEIESDGERWSDAYAFDQAMSLQRWEADPRTTPHLLDDPPARFQQFIQNPTAADFVQWSGFGVNVNAPSESPFYATNSATSYYTAWQLLEFAEVVSMGVLCLMNLDVVGWRPSDADLLATPKSTDFRPMHAMRSFRAHSAALDAIVWFTEETYQGRSFALRNGPQRRRLISPEESQEIERIRAWAAHESSRRHSVSAHDLRECLLFLFNQWIEWDGESRPSIANAYKTFAAHGVKFFCILTNQSIEQFRDSIGRRGWHFEPILDVIWPDWARQQRQQARQILLSFNRETTLLSADVSEDDVDGFLNFIEGNGLHGFYWRMESFHRHAFQGNEHSLAGLKSDVQGMSVILEHIALALGASNQQLREKFKWLWRPDEAVYKLLKKNESWHAGRIGMIDLEWFERRAKAGRAEQISADLAISYAIRGGAHYVLQESNQLNLELMLLIMLRAAIRTFIAARRPNQN